MQHMNKLSIYLVMFPSLVLFCAITISISDIYGKYVIYNLLFIYNN